LKRRTTEELVPKFKALKERLKAEVEAKEALEAKVIEKAEEQQT